MLERKDWNPTVKIALNELIQHYQNTNSYVVFDFDNTISIFDSEEMVIYYQLNHMIFKMDEIKLREMLKSGLKDDPVYNDYIDDIIYAYKRINEPLYKNEFQVKIRAMYSIINQLEGASIAYPWVCFWFTGMNEQEAYQLSYQGLSYYKDIPTTAKGYETDLPSKVGKISYTLVEGISVSENIKELFQSLKNVNIDIWICSASHIDVVRAALDVFDLSSYIKGLLAMTCKQIDHIYIPQLDNHGFYYLYDQKWIKVNQKVYASTQGSGKVKAIMDVLYPLYQTGPIAGFGDSTGDYDFLTVFQSMKLGVIFNRIRNINDGGGILSLLASYQKRINIQSNDTKYVLQGRDENKRTLINEKGTILFGKDHSQIYKDEILLEKWTYENYSVERIINESALLFTKDYQQYHTIK